MLRGLVIVIAAALIGGVAVLEGLRSNRWGESDDMRAAVARLDSIPREVGDWVGTDAPLDSKVIQIAEATGNVSRQYVNRKTRDAVSVLLLCGPPGPIGAHTPDICYGGLGYKCIGSPVARRVTFANETAAFWTARFEKESSKDDAMRIFWAWGWDGGWEASEEPRTDFAMRTALYKLYVVNKEVRPGREPAAEFMTEFLPVVKRALAVSPG